MTSFRHMLLSLAVGLAGGFGIAETTHAADECCPGSAAQAAPAGAPASDAALRGMETSASAPTGSIAVRATQHTPGGDAIGHAKVTVALHRHNLPVETLEAELDEHGVVLFEDVPLMPPFQPVVSIEYAGVTYSTTGHVMDAAHPQQKIEVACHEVTDEEPDWQIRMRHVMLSQLPPGHGDAALAVNEIIVIHNPADRTWLGETTEGGEEKVTTRFPLPEGAADIQLMQGFHGWCCTGLEDGVLVNRLPLMPGQTQVRYAYTLPAREGTARLRLSAPAATDHLMLIAPQALQAVAYDGLEFAGNQGMGNQAVQAFAVDQMQPGQQAQLVFTGLATPKAVPLEARAGSASAARWLAVFGGGVVLLVAAVLVFIKPGRSGAG